MLAPMSNDVRDSRSRVDGSGVDGSRQSINFTQAVFNGSVTRSNRAFAIAKLACLLSLSGASSNAYNSLAAEANHNAIPLHPSKANYPLTVPRLDNLAQLRTQDSVSNRLAAFSTRIQDTLASLPDSARSKAREVFEKQLQDINELQSNTGRVADNPEFAAKVFGSVQALQNDITSCSGFGGWRDITESTIRQFGNFLLMPSETRAFRERLAAIEAEYSAGKVAGISVRMMDLNEEIERKSLYRYAAGAFGLILFAAPLIVWSLNKLEDWCLVLRRVRTGSRKDPIV